MGSMFQAVLEVFQRFYAGFWGSLEFLEEVPEVEKRVLESHEDLDVPEVSEEV